MSNQQANNNEVDHAVLVKKDHFSTIWFIPLLAAAIGAYILYQSYVNAGVTIHIEFKTGEGIEAGLTKVMFKGLPIGSVEDVQVNKNLTGVRVRAVVDRSASALLRQNSRFWLVQPQISLSGVSGLDALVSGNYISVQPGNGQKEDEFIALDQAPPLDSSAPGLHLKLRADTLGSIAEGTQVYFRKIPVGAVQTYNLTSEDDGVEIHIHIEDQFAHLITKESRFWNSSGVAVSGDLTGIKVQAESIVSIITGGITFETPYLNRPKAESDAKPNRFGIPARNGDSFRLYANYADSGLESQSLLEDPNHLKITLQSKELGSISEGSKIYFRKIPVGEVYSYGLNEDGSGVDLNVKIKKQFSHLVTSQTRFWNASGVSISGGLSGLKVQTESLAAIISGGIAFATPENRRLSPSSVKDGHVFNLFEDYESAEVGITTTIRFASGEGINEGETKIKYQGIELGKVKTVALNNDASSVTATIVFHPSAEPLLREGTEFWLVTPKLSLTEITGLDTIVSGNYITLLPNKKSQKAKRQFVALDSAPTPDNSEPGLHLVLTTNELGSIAEGTKLFYRKIPVGEVKYYELNKSGESLNIYAMVKPQFSHLVNGGTKFWNASGISISGGLSGIKVRAESLLSIVAGGIAFDNIDAAEDSPKPSKNGDQFQLYTDLDEAQEKGTKITIAFDNANGLSVGSAIKYKGIQVGKITNVKFTENLNSIKLEALLQEEASNLARDGSQFWVVEPQFGLAGTSDLDTLISGQYIAVRAGSGNARFDFAGLQVPPHKGLRDDKQGIDIRLTTATLGSVKPGVGVYYREISVGHVTGYELSETSDQVIIHAHIREPYNKLIRTNTRFWNASGIGVDFSLFDGLTLDTNSFEAILEGGIAFATPDNNEMGEPAEVGRSFKLHEESKSGWLKWSPKIKLANSEIKNGLAQQ